MQIKFKNSDTKWSKQRFTQKGSWLATQMQNTQMQNPDFIQGKHPS